MDPGPWLTDSPHPLPIALWPGTVLQGDERDCQCCIWLGKVEAVIEVGTLAIQRGYLVLLK